jgi:hypothetical protein
MRSFHRTIVAAILAPPLAIALSAQQPTSNSRQQSQDMQSMQAMQGDQKQDQMDGMMQDCQKNMQSMRQQHERLRTEIEIAKQSNDPAQMRSALDKAEQALTASDTHMSNCMSMMNGAHMMGHQKPATGSDQPPRE